MSLWLVQQATNAASGNPTALWWGLGLFALAVVLLAVELFLPSGGILGLVCGASAVSSIVAFFMYSQTAGFAALFGYLGVGPIVLWVIFKFWFGSRLGKRMILGSDVTLPEDSEGALRASEHARQEKLQELKNLIGAEGLTDSPLRPVGFVKINGMRIDAMSESGVIEADTPVVVVDAYDNQIKVRPR